MSTGPLEQSQPPQKDPSGTFQLPPALKGKVPVDVRGIVDLLSKSSWDTLEGKATWVTLVAGLVLLVVGMFGHPFGDKAWTENEHYVNLGVTLITAGQMIGSTARTIQKKAASQALQHEERS